MGGNFRLDGIPNANRGVPQIEVTFDIDVDGLLSVKAKEVETGVEQSVTIQGASTLTENEVEEMVKAAEEYAAIDQEKRKNIDLKNNAPEKEQSITKLIEDIKQDLEAENFDAVTSK